MKIQSYKVQGCSMFDVKENMNIFDFGASAMVVLDTVVDSSACGWHTCRPPDTDQRELFFSNHINLMIS